MLFCIIRIMERILESIINLATSDDKPTVASRIARKRTRSINCSK